MTMTIKVNGTLQRDGGPLKLVPDAERHPDLVGIDIFCTKRVGPNKRKVHDGLTKTFVVEVTESDSGEKSYRVADFAASPSPSTAKAASARKVPRKPTTPPADTTQHQATVSTPHDRFVHPYNFVRLPSAEALAEAMKDGLFQRRWSAPHDLYDAGLKSGYIDCELSTHTHWFIPDARKVLMLGDHATLGYFTLGPVDSSTWTKAPPELDESQPAIPGSSLRGMVRSVFEAATLSCMSVLDAGTVDFRVGYSPDNEGKQSAARYVPCRVVNCRDDGSIRIQLLDGRFASDPHDPYERPAVIPVVLVNAYSPRVWREDPPHSGRWVAGTQRSDASIPNGTPVLAICSRALTRKKRKNRRGQVSYPYRFRKKCAKQLIPLAEFESVDVSNISYDPATETVIFGYLHRTGPNIDKKHDERVFFRGYARYNALVGHQLTEVDLRERLRQFLSDQEPSVTVRSAVAKKSLAMLRGYAERHGDKLEGPAPRHLSSDPQPPYFSDFVGRRPDEVKFSEGDLFYALIQTHPDVVTGDYVTVHGVYPIAIPRLTHDELRGDLLNENCYPCGRRHEKCVRCRNLADLPFEQRKLCDNCRQSSEELCPACRVFGWTRDLTHFGRAVQVGLRADPTRVDSIAGHVRFTHGTLAAGWDAANTPAIVTTLPILGTPHPSCTEFYLREKPGFSVTDSGRFPPALSRVGRNGVPSYPFAMYRTCEADLRGRKYSRRQSATDPHSSDPARGGLIRPKGKDEPAGAGGKQNQTVYLLPPNLKFKFRVYFDNLTDRELGALLFSLDLSTPRAWATNKDTELFHSLGHGTRLGMGRCSIAVTTVHVDRVDRATSDSRYRQLDGIVRERTSSNPQHDAVARDAFSSEWNRLLTMPGELGTEFKTIVAELTDMLRIVNGPVHYPNRWDARMGNGVEYFDSFSWFVANKRGDARNDRRPGMHRLPSPVDESSDMKRLPTDPAP